MGRQAAVFNQGGSGGLVGPFKVELAGRPREKDSLEGAGSLTRGSASTMLFVQSCRLPPGTSSPTAVSSVDLG